MNFDLSKRVVLSRNIYSGLFGVLRGVIVVTAFKWSNTCAQSQHKDNRCIGEYYQS